MTEHIAPPVLDGKTSDEAEEQVIHVDFIEVRLPCRSYRISYKVAEPSEFSLTTEFLLRLLRLADGMQEQDVAEFFGFSSEETRFVVDHVQSLGFVVRRNGRVYLTESGHALFGATEEPALFQVHSRQEMFDFDLIAFAPADRRISLSPFEYAFPELPVAQGSEIGRASARIFSSFKQFFQELRSRRIGNTGEKHALYTVDDVVADRRYSALVPVTVTISIDSPSTPEASLMKWRTGIELDDRSEIIQSCASFVRGIRGRSDQAVGPMNRMVMAAPEQLDRFVKGGTLNSDMLFKATARQAGELRRDRPTVRTIGSLWTDSNKSRFASALSYARERSSSKPNMSLWVRPSVPNWGMTTRLDDIQMAVEKAFSSADNSKQIKKVMVTGADSPPALQKVFNAVVPLPPDSTLRGIEVFLLPGHLAFVSVRTPLGGEEGYPVPLGILSFDPEVIQRVHKLVADLLNGTRDVPLFMDWESASILGEIESALKIGNTTGDAECT